MTKNRSKSKALILRPSGKQPSVVVVKSANGKRKRNRRGKKQLSGISGIPPVLASICAPFDSCSGHWPDQFTTLSGKAVSRNLTRQNFSAQSGTSSSHVGGMLMLPHPTVAWVPLSPVTASGNLITDLNAAGTANTWNAVANLSALCGGTAFASTIQVRCTGMGMRVEYEGTELNRSGRWFIGCVPFGGDSTVVASTGTFYSALATIGAGTPTQDVTSDVRESITSIVEGRLSDGVLEGHWIPSGVPTYQLATGNTNSYADAAFKTSAGVNPTQGEYTFFNAPPGGFGVQQGQNALIFGFQGDTTSSTIATSNQFTFNMIWHWECVPRETYNITYELTPSPYLPTELAMVINLMQTKPIGFVHDSVTDYSTSISSISPRDGVRGGDLMAYKKPGSSFFYHPTVRNVLKTLDRTYTGGLAGSIYGAFTGDDLFA